MGACAWLLGEYNGDLEEPREVTLGAHGRSGSGLPGSVGTNLNGPGTRRCTVIKGVASRITYKWTKINGELGVIIQLIGVITPITTSRGPPCRGLKNTLLKGHIRELFSLKLRMKGGVFWGCFRYCENICFVGRGIVS